MRLKDILFNNKFFLSDKGKLCLVKATLEIYPMLLLAFEDYDIITNEQIINCVLNLDFREDQILRLLSSVERYAKLWAFS